MPDVFDSTKRNSTGEEIVIKKDEDLKGKENIITSFSNPPKNIDKLKIPGHTHNPLSAFCYFPEGVKFINEDPEEKVVLLIRKHPLTNLGWFLLSFTLIFVPFFLPLLPITAIVPDDLSFTLSLIWYLMIFSFMLEKFLGWFFNVNIITDERIIEVDFFNLFYREISDTNIDQIQDVTVEIGGGIRTYLNYGDVIIQTAAEVPRIEFEAIPNPDFVAKILRESRVEEEQEKLEGRIR